MWSRTTRMRHALCVWVMGIMRATWLMHMVHTCDVTHSYDSCAWCDWFIYVWRDSCISMTCVIWLIQVVHVCDVTHWYSCDMTQAYDSHDSFINAYDSHDSSVTHSYTCDVTNAYHSHIWGMTLMWRDVFFCVTWQTHRCDVTQYVWIDIMYDSPHLYDSPHHVSHDSYGTWCVVCVTWRTHTCDVTLYVWTVTMYDSSHHVSHDSYVMWRGVVCYMTYPCIRRDSVLVNTMYESLY